MMYNFLNIKILNTFTYVGDEFTDFANNLNIGSLNFFLNYLNNLLGVDVSGTFTEILIEEYNNITITYQDNTIYILPFNNVPYSIITDISNEVISKTECRDN